MADFEDLRGGIAIKYRIWSVKGNAGVVHSERRRTMQDTLHWVIWALGIFVTGLGGFLAGYLKKKGENLAKKEDLDDLVKEVHAVTTTTKQIEAKISNEMWDRQKRWELKRDVVFDAARNIGATYDTLNAMWACHALPEDPTKVGQLEYELMRSENKAKAAVAWGTASTSYDTTIGLVTITCSQELAMGLRELMIFMRRLAQKIPENPKHYSDSLEEYVKRSRSVEALLRKELGVDQVS